MFATINLVWHKNRFERFSGCGDVVVLFSKYYEQWNRAITCHIGQQTNALSLRPRREHNILNKYGFKRFGICHSSACVRTPYPPKARLNQAQNDVLCETKHWAIKWHETKEKLKSLSTFISHTTRIALKHHIHISSTIPHLAPHQRTHRTMFSFAVLLLSDADMSP